MVRKIFICSIFCLNFFVLLSSCAYSDNLGKIELAEIYANENLEERADQLVSAYNNANDYEAFLLLPHLAKTFIKISRYEDANKYSKKLLQLSENYKGNWAYGNAMHDANMVLGLVAIHRMDIEAARDYLLKAGDTPGSYQIDNVGPNMMLAKALIELGEVKTVILYLEKIEDVWTQRNNELKSWIDLLNNGKMPDLESNLDL